MKNYAEMSVVVTTTKHISPAAFTIHC